MAKLNGGFYVLKLKCCLSAVVFILSSNPTLACDQVLCERLYKKTKEACDSSEKFCDNIQGCHKIREKCPQSVKQFDGCENFIQCVEEEFSDLSVSLRCQYKWYGIVPKGACHNVNSDTINNSWSCPGFGTTKDRIYDTSFSCDGHKERYEKLANSCENSLNGYQEFCGSCPEKISVSKCDVANEKVSIEQPTTVNNITSVINTSSREPKEVNESRWSSFGDLFRGSSNSQ